MRWIKSPGSFIISQVLLTAFLLLASCATIEKKEQAQQQPLTPRIYVANESSNSVTVIDVASLKVIATVDALNHSTHDLSVSRDGKWVFEQAGREKK